MMQASARRACLERPQRLRLHLLCLLTACGQKPSQAPHAPPRSQVDMCGHGGLDMDPVAFNALDIDGAGVRDGHMMLNIEWVGRLALN